MPSAAPRAGTRRAPSPSLARESLQSTAPRHASLTTDSAEPPEPTEHNLVCALFSETVALESLAKEQGLTLRALLAWAERRDVADLRRSMRELADDRADLIVSRARTAAAHRLEHLTSQAKSEETARKACVDLLRLRPAASPVSTPDPADDPAPEDETDAEDIIAGLDRFASHTHAPRDHEGTVPAGAD